MEWVIGISLYLAAGGIFTVFLHLFSFAALLHSKKHAAPAIKPSSLLASLLDSFIAFFFICSFFLAIFLIIPLICLGFDIHHTSKMLDEVDRADKLSEYNDHLLKSIKEKDTRIKELEKALDDEIMREVQLQRSIAHDQ